MAKASRRQFESTNPQVAGWDGAVTSSVEYLHEAATIG
jgi:hypothetical protein